MRYLPHTDEEIREMLAIVGRKSLDELFCSVPEGCRFEGDIPLPEALDEWRLTDHVDRLAAAMQVDDKYRVLIGAGSYHHNIPETIRTIMGIILPDTAKDKPARRAPAKKAAAKKADEPATDGEAAAADTKGDSKAEAKADDAKAE